MGWKGIKYQQTEQKIIKNYLVLLVDTELHQLTKNIKYKLKEVQAHSHFHESVFLILCYIYPN